MNRRAAYETEFRLINDRLTSMEQHQSQPRVSGWWSGLVHASPESVAAVSISLAGSIISPISAGAAYAIGLDGEACVQLGGGVAGLGAGFGVLCLGAGAIDLVEIVGNLSDRFFAYREHVAELKLKAPQTHREIPIYSNGEQQTTVSLPADTEFNVNTLTIPSVNIASGEREIAVDKVCLFLKTAVASSNWSRDTQAVLNKKEHPDVKAYLQSRGFWMLRPPALPRACAQLRGWGTN